MSRTKTVMGRAISALDNATTEMTHLIDIGEIDEKSPLDRKVHAALEDLYEAVHEINRTTRFKSRLREKGPLVFPVRGWDMRRWNTSDGYKGVALFPLLRRPAYTTRLLIAKSVHVGPSFLDRYRVLTTRQYLEALKDAVIERRQTALLGRVC